MMDGSAVTVKICGLTRVDTVQSVSHLPIDHIGFMLAPSKRQLSVEQAAELAKALRRNRRIEGLPLSVGVFVNPSWEELAQAVQAANLDVVQLHGEESPELCRKARESLGVRLFKALPISSGGKTSEEVLSRLEPYKGTVDAILLDTYDPTVGGGTGKTFDWSVIPTYRTWTESAGVKLIVAGGLAPNNVTELLDRYKVDGVDVSSGVETNGIKDVVKIQTFVERVKQHGRAE
jgi:phosphoribosylanthranilate isomerase